MTRLLKLDLTSSNHSMKPNDTVLKWITSLGVACGSPTPRDPEVPGNEPQNENHYHQPKHLQGSREKLFNSPHALLGNASAASHVLLTHISGDGVRASCSGPPPSSTRGPSAPLTSTLGVGWRGSFHSHLLLSKGADGDEEDRGDDADDGDDEDEPPRHDAWGEEQNWLTHSFVWKKWKRVVN